MFNIIKRNVQTIFCHPVRSITYSNIIFFPQNVSMNAQFLENALEWNLFYLAYWNKHVISIRSLQYHRLYWSIAVLLFNCSWVGVRLTSLVLRPCLVHYTIPGLWMRERSIDGKISRNIRRETFPVLLKSLLTALWFNLGFRLEKPEINFLGYVTVSKLYYFSIYEFHFIKYQRS
jgi:hypothetical protein